MRAAVDLVERQRLDPRVRRPDGVQQCDRVLVRVLVHQGQLEIAGDGAAVNLSQQGREVGIDRRMVHGRDGHGVVNLEAVGGVDAQRRQRRFDEAQPRDDARGNALFLCQGQDARHRVFGHQGCPARRKLHLRRLLLARRSRGRCRRKAPESLPPGRSDHPGCRSAVPGQGGDGGMAGRAQDHARRGLQRLPGFQGQMVGVARAEAHNGDGHGISLPVYWDGDDYTLPVELSEELDSMRF